MTAAPLCFRYQLELSWGEGRLAVQKICNQAFKIFARVNLIELTRLDQREHDRSRPGIALGVSAVPGFSANDHVPFILPIRFHDEPLLLA